MGVKADGLSHEERVAEFHEGDGPDPDVRRTFEIHAADTAASNGDQSAYRDLPLGPYVVRPEDRKVREDVGGHAQDEENRCYVMIGWPFILRAWTFHELFVHVVGCDQLGLTEHRLRAGCKSDPVFLPS